MQRSWRRSALFVLAALPMALSGAVVLSPPATAAVTDIKINEVESNGGTPGDWVELKNTGAAAVDIGGLKFKDNDDTHAFYTVPDATIVQPGGYYTLEEAAFVFGLGGADSARLFLADGTTIVDSTTWTAHAASTWGRCPDGTGTFGETTSTKALVNSCAPVAPSIKINEVESNQGTPGDWVELKNTGASSADIGGLKFRDGDAVDPTHLYTIPAGTSVAAGGYFVLEEAALTYGLGGGDSAVLLQSDGVTVVDQYSWTAHAAGTTYGRCPDGTGDFTTTQQSTKGAANICPGDIVAVPWPGGSSVTTVDDAGLATSNMSGLAYEGTGTSTPGTLWAVRNGGPEALYKLVKSGSSWLTAPGDWVAGKQLRYADGTGNPDAEGVTFTDTGSAGGMFVSTERDNAVSGTSRPAILRFAPNTAGTSLNATNDWNLTADLPVLGANLGLEGITWVPDSYLIARGLKTSGGTTYNPADYANHGTGLFFVGVEGNGMVYAYALDLTSNSYTRVTSFASGFPGVMDLHFEKESQKLWVVCDDTCQGRTAQFDVATAVGATQGTFVPVTYYERPAGMGNLNNEGLTIAPRSECSGNLKPVFWSDDNDTDTHSLRVGTISCTDPVAQTVSFTSTAPIGPVVGQTYTPTTNAGGASGNAVVRSVAAGSVDVCSISAGVVRFDHPGSCVVKADQAGNDDFAAGTAQQAITVVRANTSVALVLEATALKATVSVVAPGVAPVTGSVGFAVDGTAVGTAPLADGVATLSYSVPHDGIAHTVTAAYQGSSDLQSSAKVVSRNDPAITASVSSAAEQSATGWYRTPVTVTFTCTPRGAALTADCPAPVTIGTSGADQSVTRTITAQDGGTATVTVTDLDVDLTAPSVAIKGVKAAKTYTKKQKPTCVAADALSGLAACEVVQEVSGKRVKVTAIGTDNAGNLTETTLTYKIKKKTKK